MKARMMKNRKPVFYRTVDENGKASVFDCYGICKGSMTLEEAKKNGVMYVGDFNNLSYAEKKKIANDTVISA